MNEKNASKEKNYWDIFYSNFNYSMPSQFCTLTVSETDIRYPIIEYGCGNGRDSTFFAGQGYSVYAMDLSEEAIQKNIEKAFHTNNITFINGDVGKEKDVNIPIKLALEKNNDNPLIIYSRFFIHTLDENQERNFISTLSKSLRKDDLLYFEFRNKGNELQEKIYGDHFRRYIDESIFCLSLENKYDFEIIYKITGQGMAKFKSEDPVISRVIARKK